MGIDATFSGDGLVWTCLGQITPSQFYEANAKLVAEPRFNTIRNWIIDATCADLSGLADADVVPWADLLIAEHPGQVSLHIKVAPRDPASLGFARIFGSLASKVNAAWFYEVGH